MATDASTLTALLKKETAAAAYPSGRAVAVAIPGEPELTHAVLDALVDAAKLGLPSLAPETLGKKFGAPVLEVSHLTEPEAVLLGYPAAKQAVPFGVPNGKYGEEVFAGVCQNNNGWFTQQLRQGLPVLGLSVASVAVTGLAAGAATPATGLGLFAMLIVGLSTVTIRVLRA